MNLIWIKCFIILISNSMDTDEYSYNDAQSLLTKLFDTNQYNKEIHPLREQDDIMNISIDFHITAITQFDEQAESLTTAGFLLIDWVDELLSWKREDNNYIDSIIISHRHKSFTFKPQDDIWKPDVSLHNSYGSFKGLGLSFLNVWIKYDGLIQWEPFQVFKSTCSVDITYFPFDTQNCSLKFVAWSYTDAEVNFDTRVGINFGAYSESSTWEIAKSYTTFINSVIPTVTFTLILNRKPLFYLLNKIFPVILLSIMNIFTFTLPIKSGERASYAVTLFLSISVFLTIIASEFPRNSDNLSYLALYLTIMTTVSTIFVIITVLQQRLMNRENKNIDVGQCYMFLYKMTNCLRCKTYKRHTSKVSNIENKQIEISAETNEQKEKVTWSDVSDAMDFLCFWIGSIVISTVTLVILLTLMNNPYRR